MLCKLFQTASQDLWWAEDAREDLQRSSGSHRSSSLGMAERESCAISLVNCSPYGRRGVVVMRVHLNLNAQKVIHRARYVCSLGRGEAGHRLGM